MKVKELLSCIAKQVEEHGSQVMDYDVYTEQCTEEDKEHKRGEQHWDIIKIDEEALSPDAGMEYFHVAGFGGYAWDEEKVFVIDINY